MKIMGFGIQTFIYMTVLIIEICYASKVPVCFSVQALTKAN
jgi:hypothetical protein